MSHLLATSAGDASQMAPVLRMPSARASVRLCTCRLAPCFCKLACKLVARPAPQVQQNWTTDSGRGVCIYICAVEARHITHRCPWNRDRGIRRYLSCRPCLQLTCAKAEPLARRLRQEGCACASARYCTVMHCLAFHSLCHLHARGSNHMPHKFAGFQHHNPEGLGIDINEQAP